MSDTPAPPEDTARPARPDGSADPADPADRTVELEGLRRALADLDNARKRCAAQLTRIEAETRAAVAREWLLGLPACAASHERRRPTSSGGHWPRRHATNSAVTHKIPGRTSRASQRSAVFFASSL